MLLSFWCVSGWCCFLNSLSLSLSLSSYFVVFQVSLNASSLSLLPQLPAPSKPIHSSKLSTEARRKISRFVLQKKPFPVLVHSPFRQILLSSSSSLTSLWKSTAFTSLPLSVVDGFVGVWFHDRVCCLGCFSAFFDGPDVSPLISCSWAVDLFSSWSVLQCTVHKAKVFCVSRRSFLFCFQFEQIGACLLFESMLVSFHPIVRISTSDGVSKSLRSAMSCELSSVIRCGKPETSCSTSSCAALLHGDRLLLFGTSFIVGLQKLRFWELPIPHLHKITLL